MLVDMKKQYKKIITSLFISLLVTIFLYIFFFPSVLSLISIPFTFTALFLIDYFINYSVPKLRKTDMEIAWEVATNFWLKFRKENISTLNAKAFARYFGSTEQDRFIAFLVNRGHISEKPGYPLIIIVRMTNPPEIVDWDDNPSYEKMKNPFIDIAPYLVGTPTPYIRPELEPALHLRKIEKLKKQKEEEEEKEESATFEIIKEGDLE